MDGKLIEGKHPPLVDLKTFLKVNAFFEQAINVAVPKEHKKEEVPLKIFAKDEESGEPFTGYKTKGNWYYKTKRGKPKLHPSYVVFADLLGFKQLILNTPKSKVPSLLSRLSSALEKANEFLDSGGSEYGPSIVRYFSDCVSLITPVKAYEDQNAEASYGFTVPSLAWWQTTMVLEGFFVRGGVDFGPVMVDVRSLFGKPHLNAYDLEQCKAVNPRIIVSDEVLRLIAGQLQYYATWSFAGHQTTLLVDSDGLVFINYLSVLWEEPHHAERML
ncbi:MAG: hypothetical protein EOP04_19185, partial [Proteobacteria bacterium]